MGTIFGFVHSDLKSKIEILTELKQKSDNFTSIKVMMNYEIDSELLNKKDYVSGDPRHLHFMNFYLIVLIKF